MDEIRMLADQAAEQIAEYPVICGKEKIKRLIRGSILRQKLAPRDPFSWPNAMLGEGLLSAYEATGEKKYLLAVAEHLKRWKKAGFPIHYVDNIMNGRLALWMEELLQREDSEVCGAAEREELLALCKSAAEACAEWVRQAPKTKQGLLVYRSQHPDWLFVDTLGMVCPFLCRYGAQKGDRQLLNLGTGQLWMFLKRGMDERTGLPYHGYDEKNGMKYSVVGWGRACGWLMKGLAGSLPWIPRELREYGELLAAFRKLLEATDVCQQASGGFSWLLPAIEGHRDSSAEGMIGAAAAEGLTAGLFHDGACDLAEDGACSPAGDRACEAAGDRACQPGQAGRRAEELVRRLEQVLRQSVAGGTVKDCSGECLAFGQYPQNYGSYPWGTGSVLDFRARCSIRRQKGL